MIEEIYQEVKNGMQSTLDSLVKEFAGVRTGRATTALVDRILVDYFGTQTQLKQLATISVPESRLIVIQPWDKSVVPEVEKAIQRSNLGLNPVSDGKILRIPVPPLTEERRRDLVKVVKKKAEDRRVSVRNARRDGNKHVEQAVKDKMLHLSEDDEKQAKQEIQDLVKKYEKQVGDQIAAKTKEIAEV